MADLYELLNRIVVRQNALDADTVPVTVVGGEITHVGPLDVEITGSNMELYGTDAGRAAVSPTVVGVSWTAIDTKKIYLWDGAAWVEFLDLS